MHPALRELKHRPWPFPDSDWTWRQSWRDLAFIHYRVPKEVLRKLVPSELTLQEFDGSAWVGLVPFRMAGVMKRPWPDLPGFSEFPELNLRTYVEVGGKPGVWFFSLDAASWPVVWGGRNLYGLPYFLAKMRQEHVDGGWNYSSRRNSGGARFVARYRPVGDVFFAERGTFEHWAAERYCLYSGGSGRGLRRVEVHHAPWPLQRAEVTIETCEVLAAAGITPRGGAPVCHYSSGVDVVSFGVETICV
jgi:uncharacterized protein YqjF (DUF2071 family)